MLNNVKGRFGRNAILLILRLVAICLIGYPAATLLVASSQPSIHDISTYETRHPRNVAREGLPPEWARSYAELGRGSNRFLLTRAPTFEERKANFIGFLEIMSLVGSFLAGIGLFAYGGVLRSDWGMWEELKPEGEAGGEGEDWWRGGFR